MPSIHRMKSPKRKKIPEQVLNKKFPKYNIKIHELLDLRALLFSC